MWKVMKIWWKHRVWVQVWHLYSQTKDTNNTEHGLVLPSHSAAPIGGIVPEAWAGCVKTGTIFLHYHTGHNILKRFSKFSQLVQALFHYIWCPLVDLVVLVSVATDCTFNCFLDDVGHFINNKCSLFSGLKIIHDCCLLSLRWL